MPPAILSAFPTAHGPTSMQSAGATEKFTNGAGKTTAMHAIMGLLPGGTTSSAQAINSLGQIAGYADTADGTHAFLYAQGKMQDLGTLGEAPSHADAENDHGQVVGASGFAPDQDHAFLWQKGIMLDLNKLIALSTPWVLLRACAINNHGQIVCEGHRKDDQTAHILFLTPVSAHAH